MSETILPPPKPKGLDALPRSPAQNMDKPLAAARERLLKGLPPPDEHPEFTNAVAGAGMRRTRDRQLAYLAAYANSRNVRASALRAGVTRTRIYAWRKQRWFREQELLAEADYLDALRAQVDTRAKDSDAVLMMRAKSLLPEYREVLRQEHVVESRGELPVRFTLLIGETPPPEDEPSPAASPGRAEGSG